jgi:CRISPR/Cas system-associated exonuclease Cas4 (RecB family)
VRAVAVDEVTVTRWLLKAVENSEKRDTPITTIFVTDVASPCLRQSFYRRVKPLIPSPADFIKLVGRVSHEKLLEVVEGEGYETEVSFSEKIEFKLFGENHAIDLCGRADAVKSDHILEIKFVDTLPEEPHHWHEIQVQLYMWAFDLDTAYIVYISRRDSRVKVFKVRRSEEGIKSAISRAIKLYAHLLKNIPPKPERGGWCNSCPYALHCIGAKKEVGGEKLSEIESEDKKIEVKII